MFGRSWCPRARQLTVGKVQSGDGRLAGPMNASGGPSIEC